MRVEGEKGNREAAEKIFEINIRSGEKHIPGFMIREKLDRDKLKGRIGIQA